MVRTRYGRGGDSGRGAGRGHGAGRGLGVSIEPEGSDHLQRLEDQLTALTSLV